MKLFLLLATTAVGTTAAFQPSSKTPLTAQKSSKTSSSPPLTKNEMVAIRSPFWNAFTTADAKPVAKVDYVVEREYFVPLTLLMVGFWLALFPPSEYDVERELSVKRRCLHDMICNSFSTITQLFLYCTSILLLITGDNFAIDMIGAGFHLWFGSFIGYQTMKTRAVFNKDSFELMTVTNKQLGIAPDTGLMPKKYKNYVLGTTNKWRYDSFVNWDFFPSIDIPILVYFKETQTPKELQKKGSLGMRQMDRRENGQMHWFPAYANVRQLREQFEAHGCQKIGPVHGEEFMTKE
eukprot:scaffold17_cov194-Alexandrium_tamarense.AAC.4